MHPLAAALVNHMVLSGLQALRLEMAEEDVRLYARHCSCSGAATATLLLAAIVVGEIWYYLFVASATYLLVAYLLFRRSLEELESARKWCEVEFPTGGTHGGKERGELEGSRN